MHAVLSVEAGQASPETLELCPDQPVTLGRNHKNTVVVRDERASRRHAEITWDGDSWFLRDLNTLNGTKLDGERLRDRTPLRHGQVIGIGEVRLRLRLSPEAEEQAAAPTTSDSPRAPTLTDSRPELEQTRFDLDELAALCHFMAGAVQEGDPRALLRRTLETIRRQTGATLTGFLSLDPDEPLPKLVVPELARVDMQLSRQLTDTVQRTGRRVWLGADPEGVGESESLMAFRDALCVPLGAEDGPLGALHVYQSDACLTAQDVHFCEIVAGYVADSLDKLRTRRRLEAENSRLRGHSPAGDDLIGDSPAMVQLRQVIARIAARSGQRPPPVLVQGESGVGKELVSLALHKQSLRRDGPLVVVNCAAISPTLLEAELFGYRKGAFSGAERDHPGLFQQADEGTLFLDEVGELSPECQAKLLRVIEGKGFRPVGATAEVQADVRIIAATHRVLEEQVKRGQFRQDLYYRLAGVTVRVPPLREHPEDIPALVEHFLRKLTVECGQRVTLTEAALKRLTEYSWPGNVRQLRSVLENAVMLCEKCVLGPGDLPLPAAPVADQPPSLNLDDLQAWAIRQALRQCHSNATHAARLLGVTRETLGNKMKKYGIDRFEA